MFEQRLCMAMNIKAHVACETYQIAACLCHRKHISRTNGSSFLSVSFSLSFDYRIHVQQWTNQLLFKEL